MCGYLEKNLQDVGMKRAQLSQCLGGDYSFDNQFRDWIRMRLSIEEALNATPIVANARMPTSLTSRRRQGDKVLTKAEKRKISALTLRR